MLELTFVDTKGSEYQLCLDVRQPLVLREISSLDQLPVSRSRENICTLSAAGHTYLVVGKFDEIRLQIDKHRARGGY